MNILAVSNRQIFDDCAEFAMGIHIGRRRKEQMSRTPARESIFIVFNGTFAASVADIEISNSKLGDFPVKEGFIGEALETIELVPCEDIGQVGEMLGLSRWYLRRLTHQGHVHGSPPFSGCTTNGQSFVRFSAFHDDRRVTARGGLLPGTHSTSFTDASSVLTALTAVGHYALPSMAAPQYRFEILPPPLTDIYYGTVSPNFGQSGGGTEIEFYRGVADGHVSGPTMIPVY